MINRRLRFPINNAYNSINNNMSELKIRKMELNYSSSSKVEMAACAFTWHVNANNTKMMCT